ncbi:MAG TPA: PIG-L family deacetylase [Ramlibacter sp.]|uniref:PIG-L deacetylase family protein n=1 Tax=Ramlibacter sp. TaxID=1917967 RepID=UPI002ECFCA71
MMALPESLFPPGPRPLQLRALAWPRPLQVLVLAPHPDDFDAIGSTLRHLHLRGHVLHVAVLTTGSNGVEDGFQGAVDAAGKAALREGEQAASCAFFGLPPERLHFLRLWGEGAESDDAPLEAWIASRPADLLFLPHGNDGNRTHRRTFETVRRIAQQQRLQAWACLNQDAKTVDMRVDLVHAFGEEEARWKGGLLRLHRSQQERNLRTRGSGFDARVLEVNRKAARAMDCAQPYAEVFELVRLGA